MSCQRFGDGLMFSRRGFLVGTGAAGLVMTGRAARAFYDELGRDPTPKFTGSMVKPVYPSSLGRWDVATGTLSLPGATEDPKTIYRGGKALVIDAKAGSPIPIFATSKRHGFSAGVYNIHVMMKTDRMLGPLYGRLTLTRMDDRVYRIDSVLEDKRKRFGWSTFPLQFGVRTQRDRIKSVQAALLPQADCRLWIGAVEFINLGIPAQHPFFHPNQNK